MAHCFGDITGEEPQEEARLAQGQALSCGQPAGGKFAWTACVMSML